MNNINSSYINEYINSLIIEDSEKLNKFRDYCEKRSLPIIHEEVGQFIKLVINLLNAKIIVNRYQCRLFFNIYEQGYERWG